MGEKKITVITWDANYRGDYVDKGIECLKKQTVFDELEFIHVEWGNKSHPIITEAAFIKKHYLNLLLRDKKPSFDTGIQWNYGLHIATTAWVSYCHLDIIPRDFYEKMLSQIDKIEKNEQGIIFLEGWNINELNISLTEYDRWCNKLGEDFDLLPYKYTPKRTPQSDGVATTIKKKEFIDDCGGWIYNIPNRGEWWTGVGYHQDRFNNEGVRGHLLKTNRAMCKHPDLVAFKVPHPSAVHNGNRSIKNVQEGPPLEKGGIKDYNDFVNEWEKRIKKDITII